MESTEFENRRRVEVTVTATPVTVEGSDFWNVTVTGPGDTLERRYLALSATQNGVTAIEAIQNLFYIYFS
jgi:hypothetical protein